MRGAAQYRATRTRRLTAASIRIAYRTPPIFTTTLLSAPHGSANTAIMALPPLMPHQRHYWPGPIAAAICHRVHRIDHTRDFYTYSARYPPPLRHSPAAGASLYGSPTSTCASPCRTRGCTPHRIPYSHAIFRPAAARARTPPTTSTLPPHAYHACHPTHVLPSYYLPPPLLPHPLYTPHLLPLPPWETCSCTPFNLPLPEGSGLAQQHGPALPLRYCNTGDGKSVDG